MTWVLTLVARTPQAAGPPLLEDVEPLHFTNLSYSDVLNEDGDCQFSVNPETLGPDARQRLRDLAAFPCEIRINHDGQAVWAGPIWGYARQGNTITVNCRGLLGYTRLMQVDSATGDLTFSEQDESVIVAGLIDAWQALQYGHYGLDTAGMTPTGQIRTRNYIAADRHNIYDRLQELTQVVNGPDIWVDPATRKVHVA